jgi:aminocarboxymuconate-semialdehyde decarboxylase
VHDAASLRFLVDFAGINRVALGSDYPFPLGEEVPGTLIKSMQFSIAEKERLLNGTAREWLGLS